MHPTHCLICAQVPSLLEENIAEAAEARKRGRRARALPFATELPTGATYYVLKRRPELAETPAGKIVASEQAASRGPHDAEAFVRSLGEAAPGRLTSLVGHLLVCLVGTFLLLHEEVQETMLEELVAALPVFASGVLGLIPTTLMERDDGVGDCAEIKFRAPHAIDATCFRSCVCAMAWRFHAIDATFSPWPRRAS